MSGICWQARTSQDLPIKTTNREGRRFESCRARHRKPRKLRGFALEFHPFSWPGSPFDRNNSLEVAFRALPYMYIRGRSQSYARFHRSKCCSLTDNYEEGVRRARKRPETKKERTL